MQVADLNLAQTLITEMKRLEFSDVSISYIKGKQLFVDSYNKESNMQRNLLSMLLYKTMMYSNVNLPKEIRLALNMANDNIGWLDDIKLVILPYLKANEELFFPIA